MITVDTTTLKIPLPAARRSFSEPRPFAPQGFPRRGTRRWKDRFARRRALHVNGTKVRNVRIFGQRGI